MHAGAEGERRGQCGEEQQQQQLHYTNTWTPHAINYTRHLFFVGEPEPRTRPGGGSDGGGSGCGGGGDGGG